MHSSQSKPIAFTARAGRAWLRSLAAVMGLAGMLFVAPQVHAAQKEPYPLELRTGNPSRTCIRPPLAQVRRGYVPKEAMMAGQYWAMRQRLATAADGRP